MQRSFASFNIEFNKKTISGVDRVVCRGYLRNCLELNLVPSKVYKACHYFSINPLTRKLEVLPDFGLSYLNACLTKVPFYKTFWKEFKSFSKAITPTDITTTRYRDAYLLEEKLK